MRLLAALILAAVPYIESIDVTVNNVDVIVTDRAGNRVHGLQKGDFELTENGAPQTVSNFYEVRGAEHTRVAGSSDAAAPPAHEPQKLVMIFDELSLHPATAGDLEHRAKELVGTAMQPGDELMILTPNAKTKIVLPFTSDKRAIDKAIGQVMKDSAFHASTQLMRELLIYQNANRGPGDATSAARMYEMMATRRVKQTLGYLQAVVTAMAEVPGKKSVIFVTQSAPIEPGRDAITSATTQERGEGRPSQAVDAVSRPITGDWRTLRPYVDDIARTASTNGVTIYCLQPDIDLGARIPDVVDSGRPGRGNVRVLSSVRAGPTRPTFNAATQGTEETFETLSSTTGGKWWRGGAGIQPLFRQVADDATDYYSLGYRASNQERDKAREIVVRVRNHPEYEVRARRAVIRKSAPNEMRDQTIARLLDDRNVDELGVRVSAGEAKREATGSLLVPIDIKIPLSKLTFLRDGDVYRASFRVHYAAESSALDFAPGEGRVQEVEVPIAQMPAIGSKYFTYSSSLRVRRGELKVAVGVLDPLSNLTSIKTMTVEAR